MTIDPDSRPDLFAALTGLVAVGLLNDQDAEARELLDALRILWPDVPEVRIYDAWFSMRSNDFADAARVLSALLEHGAGAKTSLCRGLLAASLFVLEDPSWRGHADAVVEENTDSLAVQFARQLRGESPAQVEPESPGAGIHSDSVPPPVYGRFHRA